MTMHAYGFVLPGNWTWSQLQVETETGSEVYEGWHQLICHNSVHKSEGEFECQSTWRFPDAELAHVACLDLQNLARDHEHSLHSGAMRVGMRVAPGGMNCLGAAIEPPQWPITQIRRKLFPSPHAQVARGTAPVLPPEGITKALDSSPLADHRLPELPETD